MVRLHKTHNVSSVNLHQLTRNNRQTTNSKTTRYLYICLLTSGTTRYRLKVKLGPQAITGGDVTTGWTGGSKFTPPI